MIIHSHEKHISLQILHWTRNDVVVQCSFINVCQGVPNKMLGASYTNRDVWSFQTRDLYCNGRNMYVQLSHLLFVLEMLCRTGQNCIVQSLTMNLIFFTISNLNYTVFVILAHILRNQFLIHLVIYDMGLTEDQLQFYFQTNVVWKLLTIEKTISHDFNWESLKI